MPNQPWVDELVVPLCACRRGIDIANRFTDAQTAWENWPIMYIGDLIWTIGQSDHPDKDRLLRHFGCDCAERVLHIFEEKYPNDKRPRRAIEVARLYADGKATMEELSDSRESALDASSCDDYLAADCAADCAAASADDWPSEMLAEMSSDLAAASVAVIDYDMDSAIESERAWQITRLRHYFPKNPLLKR